ncbi:polysaccharide biosynthesis protein [Flavobacteriaceae bacterium]|nr:polysaccharide biosynthesis protein [Flavobacteriaceae bacterium]
MFDGKILLITGGTGSFGQTILKKFQEINFQEIRVFSRDEKKQHDLRIQLSNSRIKFFIGDVRDVDSVENVVRGVDYIFHAAALKQVPACEFFPLEATKTNVIGTSNVITAAIKYGVKKVICLSTDKAAYPINAMGISKSLMEKIAIANSRNSDNTIICVTRYGNVMASRGSVIPHFIDQIKKNMPLTLTEPKMTRFLMSLDEAVDLVLFAFMKGNTGDLFIQKSPASSIIDLATAVQQLFKSTKNMIVIGKRHGEKMHETLATSEELANAEDIENYYRISADTRDLNYSKYYIEGNLNIQSDEDYNSSNTVQLSVNQIKEKLLSLDYIKNELEII